jgi:hypothetical protein
VKLIDNARQWYKLAVMWVQGFGASAMAAWLLLDDAQRAAVLKLFGIPDHMLVAVGALVVFLTGMAARVVKQDLKP